jgi:predicted nucleic acid-binding protein
MKDKVFIDTNILVYFATDISDKKNVIVTKLAEHDTFCRPAFRQQRIIFPTTTPKLVLQ